MHQSRSTKTWENQQVEKKNRGTCSPDQDSVATLGALGYSDNVNERYHKQPKRRHKTNVFQRDIAKSKTGLVHTQRRLAVE